MFKRQLLCTLIAIGVSTLPSHIIAATPVEDEDCSQEILLSYFPGVFVDETLTRFNVPKNQTDAIKKELAARDKEIIKQVEAKAAKMDPNPLKDPQQRQAAVKLFRETLLENFSAVMKAHDIKDDKQIQAMLDDIQQQKAKRFARCMENQRNKQGAQSAAASPKSAAASAMNDGDEDDSDDQDDEDDDEMDNDEDQDQTSK